MQNCCCFPKNYSVVQPSTRQNKPDLNPLLSLLRPFDSNREKFGVDFVFFQRKKLPDGRVNGTLATAEEKIQGETVPFDGYLHTYSHPFRGSMFHLTVFVRQTIFITKKLVCLNYLYIAFCGRYQR